MEKIHPDFELVEWNESNAPLEDNNYVKEAFAQKNGRSYPTTYGLK
uniref:Uncharacterized protein n=1 Tax=Chryseobacterium endophyticum TaxID=1854762 RepID=A0AAU6WP43_9FLAO